MFHTVYKTTNLISGKVYIGYHFTSDPNDSYLGSGKLLKRAIRKHGKEHFSKEVIACFDTAEAALAKEAELVNEEFVTDPMTYNTTIGGGVPPNSRRWWTEAHSEAARGRMIGNSRKLGVKESDETKARKREAFAKSSTHAAHTKHKSIETCEKISAARKGLARGDRNAMANPANVQKVRLSKIGLKKFVKGDDSKMARPNTDKWVSLIDAGYEMVN